MDLAIPEKPAGNCRATITTAKEGLRGLPSNPIIRGESSHQAAGLQSNPYTWACAVHASAGYMRETLACLRWWLSSMTTACCFPFETLVMLLTWSYSTGINQMFLSDLWNRNGFNLGRHVPYTWHWLHSIGVCSCVE